MNSENKLCFVQFIHPGKEHRPDRDGFKDWNREDHRRKFVEVQGRCVRNAEERTGPLRFWAEWEPQSKVIGQIDEPDANGPAFIYEPFYIVPGSYQGLQNTDPFVFGGFFYTGCQQYTKKGPTKLRDLNPGCVILFGSRVSGKFAIDTVFVIGDDPIDHDLATYQELLSGKVPQEYFDVTLRPWYHEGCRKSTCPPGDPRRKFRLYFGATIDNPYCGMYSFFPCRTANECPRGFARPVIAIPEVIAGSLSQGKKLNEGLSLSQVKDYWEKVREAVEADPQGLWLGVEAQMPKRRMGT